LIQDIEAERAAVTGRDDDTAAVDDRAVLMRNDVGCAVDIPDAVLGCPVEDFDARLLVIDAPEDDVGVTNDVLRFFGSEGHLRDPDFCLRLNGADSGLRDQVFGT
jgi:hypothetical protein